MPLPETLAAIDVGTNSFHLLVVRLLGENRFSVIAKEKIVVRLGEGAAQMKHLSEEAINRGVDAMKLFSLVAGRTGSPIIAIATSAVREATNADEFIERVREETGIGVAVISGFEEARLIYLGVMQALPVFNRRSALFDLGGGSTEFLVGEQGRILYANSFKIGAIRMTQRFFPHERITPQEIEACRIFLRGEIYHASQEIKRHGIRELIASSGTAQTVAAMVIAARGELAPESLTGQRVTLKEIRSIASRVLKARTFAERSEIPGVDPRRADLLAAGVLTVETVVEECDADAIVISSYALREGIILDAIQTLEGARGEARLSDLRFETVMKIGRMYNFDEAHCRKVADLALNVYDGLTQLHRLDERSREHLEAAALLHDIGYYISHASHHKHSYYLIRNSEALGFTNEEMCVIANIARYHRKSHPKVRHPDFSRLRPNDQRRVRILSAILRIADGLDRTHNANVESVAADWDDEAITIQIACRPDSTPTFELWSADQKKGLMEEVFSRRVVFAVEFDGEELAAAAALRSDDDA